MPNVNKFHSKNYDVNFNLLLFFLIVLTLVGNYWMVVNDIFVGTVYFFMYLGVIAIIVLTHLFLKGDQLKQIGQFLKAPFSISNNLAIASYLAGWGLVVILEIVLNVYRGFSGSSFSLTSFSIPLFGNDILKGIAQSFTAVEFAQSMPWKIFNISFNAGATEEFVFTFGLMLLGAMVGYFLLKVFFNNKAPLGLSSRNFIVGFAIILSTLLFAYTHQLNATYTTITFFVIAGLFKLISLIGVYFFGLFLTFWIGYHQGNNLIYLIQQDGIAAVSQGFFSIFGVFFVLFFLGLIFVFLRNFNQIRKEIITYIKS